MTELHNCKIRLKITQGMTTENRRNKILW